MTKLRPLVMTVGAGLSLLLLADLVSRATFGSTREILFVVPDGFRGKFDVGQDRTLGSVTTIVNGQVRILVPKSGRVRLKDASAFDDWLIEQAVFEDGVPLKPPGPDTAHGKELGLFGLGTDDSGKSYYYVGTEDGYKKALYERDHPVRITGSRPLQG